MDISTLPPVKRSNYTQKQIAAHKKAKAVQQAEQSSVHKGATATFSYEDIPDHDVRNKVREAANCIHDGLRVEQGTRLEIGRILNQVKEIKEFGFFDRWVEAEFQFTKRTADNYMALARTFGDAYRAVSYLPSHLLYQLAQGKSLQDTRSKVIAAAVSGQQIAKSEVQQLIRDAKPLRKNSGEGLAETEVNTAEMARIDAARSAVALLRERLDDEFSNFVKLYCHAGDAFGAALNEAI